MKAHDFLFADTADDCATGIETRHRRATEETQESIGRDTESIGRDTDKPHPNSRESLQASDRDNKIQC